MKVLSILLTARLREDFVEVVQKNEECVLTPFNPFTGGPDDVKKIVEDDGYDFIIYDYGPPTDRSRQLINLFRAAVPSTPMLVFSIYEHIKPIAAEEKCSHYNWREHYTWRENGQELLTKAIEEARQLIV